MRISKDAPIAVRIAQPGESPLGTVIKQVIDPYDKYNLGRDQLAEKLGLSGPRTTALILDLEIKADADCYHEWYSRSTKLNGYSKKALDLMRAAKESMNLEEVWQRQRHKLGARQRSKSRP
jgi:hypothetical protein